jgi:hypothetical protein
MTPQPLEKTMFAVIIGTTILVSVLAVVAVIAGVVSYIRTPDALTKREQERARLAARINAL